MQAFPTPKMHKVRSGPNAIQLAVYEQGEGPAVVLSHGFPELAFSWRYQLPALAAAGFLDIALAEGTGPLEAALVTERVAHAAGVLSIGAQALVAPALLGMGTAEPVAIASLAQEASGCQYDESPAARSWAPSRCPDRQCR